MTTPDQRARSFASPSGMARVVPARRNTAGTVAELSMPRECFTEAANAARTPTVSPCSRSSRSLTLATVPA